MFHFYNIYNLYQWDIIWEILCIPKEYSMHKTQHDIALYYLKVMKSSAVVANIYLNDL